MSRRHSSSDLHTPIADIGEALDAAANNPLHWQEVVNRLHRHLPGSKIIMQGYDRTRFSALHFASVGWEGSTLKAHEVYYSSINPWKQAWIDMVPFRAMRADSKLPLKALWNTEFYTDLLRPEGEVDGASGMKLVDSEEWLATLAVHYDSKRTDQMHLIAQPLLQGLAERMRQTIHLNRIAAQSSPALAYDPGLLHALGQPAFIVDSTARILAQNSQAEIMVSSGILLRTGASDRIKFLDPLLHAQFLHKVGQICSSNHQSQLGDVMIDRPDGAFSMSLFPLSQNLAEMELTFSSVFLPLRVALIIIRPIADAQARIRGQLQRQFKLTNAESRLVLALDQGGSLVQIASTLGISYETARGHLKSIFAKTDTHNQRELVALTLKPF